MKLVARTVAVLLAVLAMLGLAPASSETGHGRCPGSITRCRAPFPVTRTVSCQICTDPALARHATTPVWHRVDGCEPRRGTLKAAVMQDGRVAKYLLEKR